MPRGFGDVREFQNIPPGFIKGIRQGTSVVPHHIPTYQLATTAFSFCFSSHAKRLTERALSCALCPPLHPSLPSASASAPLTRVPGPQPWFFNPDSYLLLFLPLLPALSDPSAWPSPGSASPAAPALPLPSLLPPQLLLLLPLCLCLPPACFSPFLCLFSK